MQAPSPAASPWVATASITREAALDGFYVLRTSVPAETLDGARVVLAYKSLAQVERAFRSMKTVDLHWPRSVLSNT